MNCGAVTLLLSAFDEHWCVRVPEFAVRIEDHEVELDETHPLQAEIAALCSGQAGSLPHFTAHEVIWCTIAPDSNALRAAIAELHAWVLPSFGGEGAGDGYVRPDAARTGLAASILAASPDGYYRWRCRSSALATVLEKLALHRGLASRKPERSRPARPSLYELRARFATALLVGDRNGAEQAIELLDTLQLDSAVNTQFMRIRMWHHFREYDRIREHPDLHRLTAQPLPSRVHQWITEALAASGPPGAPPEKSVSPATDTAALLIEQAESKWQDWFEFLRHGDRTAAELFLTEHRKGSPAELSAVEVNSFVGAIEDLFLDDGVRQRERNLIIQGIAEFLEEFIRESEFPRAAFGDLYLALLRVWSALYAGTSSGQEHGHVLLELASAALQLNRAPEEVLKIIEQWWEARPARSQLPFVLDAIELLEREFPNPEASANLWLAAADLILRAPDALAPSEKALWRRVGKQLAFDDITISRYVPPDAELDQIDPLAEANLRHIAIVCMREAQARDAAAQIQERTGAEVSVVIGKAAGSETDHAKNADVVLFVWMATSHAVFRAFDGFDRRRFCYVQGTGASSIVRALERWTLD
jgi:hypothetical protein